MKRSILYTLTMLLFAVALVACNGMNTLLKSGQPDDIYKQALKYYEKEKWSRAATLFEGAHHYYIGTSREDSITFFHARCKFKGHDYETASQLLDDFRRRFGRSAFIEEAEAMYAYCFYQMSPGPARDQTMTGKAVIAINEFVSRYPNSDKVENFMKMNDELTDRMHEKAYLNAYTYYKIGRYKSAIVALKNALRTYPESRFREEIMFLIVDSSYRLAENSIAEKQTDRYLAMLDSYLSFHEEFPESEHTKEVDRMAEKARDYLARNKQNDATEEAQK
ncbi:MAG: outer membrane protein assembly factor BamD [Alistipes sp.]|nr:outer membrane protein assembly factor BamD [Alistipes sp.]